MNTPKIAGWVEIEGKKLSIHEIGDILKASPEKILRFGGEFFLAGDGCRAGKRTSGELTPLLVHKSACC